MRRRACAAIALTLTIASCADKRGELVRRRDERHARFRRAMTAATVVAEARMRVEAGADRRAAERQRHQARRARSRSPARASSSCATQPEITWPSVNGVASCRCVRPIITMSANACALASSVARRRSSAGSRRRSSSLDRRDVHDGGKRVVRRLPAVDVVVRMDRLFRADDAAGELDRAVGDHLVGIHVRLRAGTGLKHDQRKFAVELAVDHFLRRALDQRDLVGRQFAELAVGDAPRLSSARRTRGSPGGPSGSDRRRSGNSRSSAASARPTDDRRARALRRARPFRCARRVADVLCHGSNPTPPLAVASARPLAFAFAAGRAAARLPPADAARHELAQVGEQRLLARVEPRIRLERIEHAH